RTQLHIALRIEIEFLNTIAQIERAIAFLEAANDTPQEILVLVQPACDTGKGPESAREVISEIVELLKAIISSKFQRQLRTNRPKMVVDILIVGLEAVDGKCPGVANDGAVLCAAEANDRSVVPGSDVNPSAATTYSQPQFSGLTRAVDMGEV